MTVKLTHALLLFNTPLRARLEVAAHVEAATGLVGLGAEELGTGVANEGIVAEAVLRIHGN